MKNAHFLSYSFLNTELSMPTIDWIWPLITPKWQLHTDCSNLLYSFCVSVSRSTNKIRKIGKLNKTQTALSIWCMLKNSISNHKIIDLAKENEMVVLFAVKELQICLHWNKKGYFFHTSVTSYFLVWYYFPLFVWPGYSYAGLVIMKKLINVYCAWFNACMLLLLKVIMSLVVGMQTK